MVQPFTFEYDAAFNACDYLLTPPVLSHSEHNFTNGARAQLLSIRLTAVTCAVLPNGQRSEPVRQRQHTHILPHLYELLQTHATYRTSSRKYVISSVWEPQVENQHWRWKGKEGHAGSKAGRQTSLGDPLFAGSYQARMLRQK
ncbi:hypothetical protein PV04_09852 [Phialophora macrospora]|uniref:Uncharacterized protein n=1 Tax=Phialophora macrospora TaxID=1851006 RepID=A0A0D2F523_9EURO|nr:hypothetical protein PV04_09852 [Phialophora macrospora]